MDAGSRNFVGFVDIATMKRIRDAALPMGSGELGAFSSDDSKLLVRWLTPAMPPDVFAVSIATGKPTSLRDDPRPGLSGLPELDVNIDSIAAHDGLRIPVNTYAPRGATGKLPVLVMVHGGPAASSTVSYSPLVRLYGARFCGGRAEHSRLDRVRPRLRAGRRRTETTRRTERCRDRRALDSRSNVGRPDPAGDLGGSYGGYMVLMGMTRQSDIWRAGVDLVGPSSWRWFMATTTGQIREVLSKEFGSVEKDGAFLDSISPLGDVAKVKNPLFVFQGKNDPRVPKPESDQIVLSLRKRGIPVEYFLAADEGHLLDRRPNQVAFAARTTLFLKKHLAMK